MTVLTFTTAGTFNPSGLPATIEAQAWGAGGGGNGSKHTSFQAGNGAGGGEFAQELTLAVSAGTVTVVVGAAGTGGAAQANGTAGGQSTVAGTSVTVTANGGSPGVLGGSGGAGGTGSTNTTHFAGAAGAAGSIAAPGGGGGGGSSAGTGSTGNAGAAGTGSVGGAGGTAVTGGGPGGNGGFNTAGVAPVSGPGGGGGGGSISSSNADNAGAAGWAGQVVLTYTVSGPSPVWPLRISSGRSKIAALRKGKRYDIVPPVHQAILPTPQDWKIQRFESSTRGKRWLPVPTQLLPPVMVWPARFPSTRVRLFALQPRGKDWFPTPHEAHTNPVNTWLCRDPATRNKFFMLQPHGHRTFVVPPQIPVPTMVWPNRFSSGRSKVAALRKGRQVTTTPGQIYFTNPAIVLPIRSPSTRVRLLPAVRRGHIWMIVPPQIAVPSPVWPTRYPATRVRLYMVQPRGHQEFPVQPQIPVPTPVWPTRISSTRGRFFSLQPRGERWMPTPHETHNNPVNTWTQRDPTTRNRFFMIEPRGKRSFPVQPQIPTPIMVWPTRVSSLERRLFALDPRGKRWMPTPAQVPIPLMVWPNRSPANERRFFALDPHGKRTPPVPAQIPVPTLVGRMQTNSERSRIFVLGRRGRRYQIVVNPVVNVSLVGTGYTGTIGFGALGTTVIPAPPSIILSPRPVAPGPPSVNWQWYIAEPTYAYTGSIFTGFNLLAPLFAAKQRQINVALNGIESASFSINTLDPAAQYINPITNCLVCYRNGEIVWSGPIWTISETVGDGQEDVQVNAVGWFQQLMSRLLKCGTYGVNPMVGPATSPYGGSPAGSTSTAIAQYYYLVDPVQIAVDLMLRTNFEYPTGIWVPPFGTYDPGYIGGPPIDPNAAGGGQPLNPNGIQWTMTVNQLQNIGQMIQQLSNIESGFDFRVDPATLIMNFYYGLVKSEFTIYGRGTDKPNAIFKYGQNLSTLTRTIDPSKLTTQMTVIGQYGQAQYPAPGVGSAAITTYGLWEALASLSSVVSSVITAAYATEEVLFLDAPQVIYSMAPVQYHEAAENGMSVPQPFQDYDIGDFIYIGSNYGRMVVPPPAWAAGNPNQYYPVRLYSMQVNIDDEGNERVTDMQTTYSTSS